MKVNPIVRLDVLYRIVSLRNTNTLTKHWEVWAVMVLVLLAGAFTGTLIGHIEVLNVAAGLLQLAFIVVLVQAYRQTRDAAFVWLGVALVVWPLISAFLQVGERSVIDRMYFGPTTPYQQSAIPLFIRERITAGTLMVFFGMVRECIGSGILLVAMVYLSRMRSTRIDRAAGVVNRNVPKSSGAMTTPRWKVSWR